MKLSNCKVGQQGKIEKIGSRELEIALMRLGMAQGDEFTLTNQAPFNGPFALEISGTKIALRKRDAQEIEVSISNA